MDTQQHVKHDLKKEKKRHKNLKIGRQKLANYGVRSRVLTDSPAHHCITWVAQIVRNQH